MGFFDFFSGKSSTNAADELVNGYQNARGDIQTNLSRLEDLYNPAIASGDTARTRLEDILGLHGAQAGADAFGAYQQSPGMKYALDTGRGQIDNSAASRGQLLSGSTLASLQQHGIGMANQDFGNYQSRLAGLSDSGASARGQYGSLTTNGANNLASLSGKIGQANADGIIGQAQARENIFNGGVNIASQFLGRKNTQKRSAY